MSAVGRYNPAQVLGQMIGQKDETVARQINRLNARAVATITKHGRHADGGSLYLSISPNGGRRWVFLFRWHGKPTEIGFPYWPGFFANRSSTRRSTRSSAI
jgi:hypothetical protein